MINFLISKNFVAGINKSKQEREREYLKVLSSRGATPPSALCLPLVIGEHFSSDFNYCCSTKQAPVLPLPQKEPNLMNIMLKLEAHELKIKQENDQICCKISTFNIKPKKNKYLVMTVLSKALSAKMHQGFKRWGEARRSPI